MSGQSSLSSTLRFSRRAARGATAFLVTLVAVTACDDPNKPETWIKRLRDPEHAVEAVRRLEKMGDPVAVEPLCKLFEDYPHTSILKAIISFKDKRSIPTLRKALDFSDENQYHNSTKAAHALAEMGVGEAVPDLIKVMQKPLPIKSRANLAKQAAIEALAKLGDKRAVPALIEVADAQPDKQDFHLNKVAVVALGKLGDPAAIPVLIRSLFKGSRLQGSSFSQATVALVRFGDAAVEPLIRAMKGEDKQLNRFAEGLSTPLRPGELLSKTASVLGDLRASKAVPALLAALRSGRQAEDEASKAGLEGVLIALGKIRDTRAVGPLLALIQDAKADARLRIKTARALTALGDPSAVPVLSALAESGYLEGGLWDLRVDAVMAYSRIVGKRAAQGVKMIKAVLADEKVSTLPEYKPIRTVFEQALARVELAAKCKQDASCYAEVLSDNAAKPILREKAAVMIGLLPGGREGLDALVKALPARDPGLRQFMLESAKSIGNASDAELIKTLEMLAEKDAKRRAKYVGADLARYDMVALLLVKRKQA